MNAGTRVGVHAEVRAGVRLGLRVGVQGGLVRTPVTRSRVVAGLAAGLLAAGPLLSGCTGGSGDGGSEPKPLPVRDVSGLRVTSTTTLVGASQSVLSPDGKNVLLVGRAGGAGGSDAGGSDAGGSDAGGSDAGGSGAGGSGAGEVCVQRIGDAARRCAHGGPASVSVGGWSPDGKSVVLTEDWGRTLHDPDVWLLDVASMSMRDLTDDGATRMTGRGSEHGHIDRYPAFVGGKVRFLRTDPVGGVPHLCSMSPSGGGVDCDATLPPEMTVLGFVAWSPDGSHVAVVGNGRVPSLLWVTDAKGHEQWKATAPARTLWVRADFSPDGRYVLVQPNLQYGAAEPPELTAQVFATEQGGEKGGRTDGGTDGGRVRAIDVDGGGHAYYAGWARDSDAIVYAGTAEPEIEPERNGIWVVGQPGRTGRRLVEELGGGVRGSSPDQQGLQWAGDRVLATVAGDQVVLTLTG